MKKARIYIPVDQLNKSHEQFKIFQVDGITYKIGIGKMATVPLAVAERAKEIGLIDDYDSFDE